MKKRLTYVVTPKGNRKDLSVRLSLFYPHLVLGTLTFLCLLAAVFMNRRAPLLLFWAILNTVIMYGFFLGETVKKTGTSLFKRSLPWVFLSLMVIFSIGLVTLFSINLFKERGVALVPSETYKPVPLQIQKSEEIQVSTKYHQVLYGETLWSISKKYYGKGSDWKKIQTNDHSTIIHPGEVLTILGADMKTESSHIQGVKPL